MFLVVEHTYFNVGKGTKNILSDQTRTCVGKDTTMTRILIIKDYKLTLNMSEDVMKD